MATADRGGLAGLDACVHCGFCLQACPTFLATGDEADSPRGRIELMRAVESGTLAPDDPAVTVHLDRCLGCRGCEPVCPSGVTYGRALETVRERLTAVRGATATAAALRLLTGRELGRGFYAASRTLRAVLPRGVAGWGRLRFALGMLAATRPNGRTVGRPDGRIGEPTRPTVRPRPSGSPLGSDAVLFRGCVMDGLFRHVHDATVRTLTVNGYRVGEAAGQECCGALHAHAGLTTGARALARANITAFGSSDRPIVVNSAGCGAMLKEYAHLLPGDTAAARFAARVRDVTEVLAERGPQPGGTLAARVAYDPPCHLLHAQRVADAPRRVLAAVPGLDVIETPGAAQCCGAAGLYSLAQPAMARAVLAPKLAELRAAAPDVVATGNPGCAMQLGAGLAAAGITAAVMHPVELLDRSYALAGLGP